MADSNSTEERSDFVLPSEMETPFCGASGDILQKTRIGSQDQRKDTDEGLLGMQMEGGRPRSSRIPLMEEVPRHQRGNFRNIQTPPQRTAGEAAVKGVNFHLQELRDSRYNGRSPACENRRPRSMSDHFDGKGQWKQYLVHFDTVAELHGWDNMERLQYLSVSLRGEACMLMQSQAKEEKFTVHKEIILKTQSRFLCFRCFAGNHPKQNSTF